MKKILVFWVVIMTAVFFFSACTERSADIQFDEAFKRAVELMDKDKIAFEMRTVKRRCNLPAATKVGKYDWVSKYFTTKKKDFYVLDCVEGEEVKVRLFNSESLGEKGDDPIIDDGVISTESAKERIRSQGCRVADWTVLLPLGEKYPDLQRNNSIVGLGSTYGSIRDGGLLVPVLTGNDYERLLLLHRDGIGYRWDAGDHFAAVCK